MKKFPIFKSRGEIMNSRGFERLLGLLGFLRVFGGRSRLRCVSSRFCSPLFACSFSVVLNRVFFKVFWCGVVVVEVRGLFPDLLPCFFFSIFYPIPVVMLVF